MTAREALASEFTNGEVLQFEGRGGKTFDYIEDETVMDRLDEVLGVGAWSIRVEAISLADGVVKVQLSGFLPDGHEFTYEDFGYQTRDGGEGLKEAVSDGIRRCGRYLGIGRYLYKKHETRQNGPGRPQNRPPQSQSRAPIHAVPDEPPGLMDDLDGGDDSTCPEHGIAWIGSFGDRYHKKPEGGYCRTAPGNVAKPRR